MDIREVAASAAGNPDFFADGFITFENDGLSAPLSRFDSAHQTGGSCSNDHHVVNHGPIISRYDARGGLDHVCNVRGGLQDFRK